MGGGGVGEKRKQDGKKTAMKIKPSGSLTIGGGGGESETGLAGAHQESFGGDGLGSRNWAKLLGT